MMKEEEVEQLAREFHNVYQDEAKRQGDVRHADDYDDLPENVKEFDRVLARHVLTQLQQAERERDERDKKEAQFRADVKRQMETYVRERDEARELLRRAREWVDREVAEIRTAPSTIPLYTIDEVYTITMDDIGTIPNFFWPR